MNRSRRSLAGNFTGQVNEPLNSGASGDRRRLRQAAGVVGRDYLACGAARRQATCGDRRAIRREVLESVILDALRSRLRQPDLVAEFAEAYQQEVNRQPAGADAVRERTAGELAQVERKLAGLLKAIANGLCAPSLQQTLDDLEQRRAELTIQLEEAPAPLPRLTGACSEDCRIWVETAVTQLT